MSAPEIVNISIKLDEPKYMPSKAHDTDAGWDVYSTITLTIPPGQFAGIPLGISVAIQPGYCIILKERSGLALKNGIRIGGGVIDASYRGELKAIFHNLGDRDFKVEAGMKIAQMLVLPVPFVLFTPVQTLNETRRGTGGFGSTGV